jgi:hypothetical protein
MAQFYFQPIFQHTEICSRPALHFVGRLGMARCMAGTGRQRSACVVLSYGLRIDSYTPAGCVREVPLGASYGEIGLRKVFVHAT